MADSVFVVRPIKPKKMNIKQFIDVIKEAMKFEGDATRRSYKTTIETWEKEKPEFKSTVDVRGKDAIVFTGPKPGGKGFDKFLWIDRGTRIRYATMSSNWQSKTKPGRLKSGPGSGRMLYVSRKRPRPGIKARGFTEKIAERRKKEFPARIARQFEKAARNIY